MNTDNNFGTGALDRPDDYGAFGSFQHSEIAGAFQPAVWTEKDPTSGFLTYPKRNQGGQGTCTCYAMAKALGVDELSENGAWRELSPRSLYPYVALQGGGASSVKVSELSAKIGMTLEYLLPTDGLSEADVESDKGYASDAKQIALVYKPQSFIQAAADFETIASILQGFRAQGQKKAVMVTLIGENNGTWLSAFPKPPDKVEGDFWYHRVPVVDFGLINGKKVLAIDNSWGESAGLKGQQFIAVEYEPYMYGAIYTLNQPDNWQALGQPSVKPPMYKWSQPLSVGSSGPDVLALQTALQSMGMFPIQSVVKPTGSFYGVTKAGVILFQAAFGLPQTGVADVATREKLNQIFA